MLRNVAKNPRGVRPDHILDYTQQAMQRLFVARSHKRRKRAENRRRTALEMIIGQLWSIS